VGYVYTDNAGLRVPDENAADDVPADLSFLADQLDTAVVLQAVSVAERDSKFYDAPSGAICVVRAGDGTISGVYVKTSNEGSATWGTIWSPRSPSPQSSSRTPTRPVGRLSTIPGCTGRPGASSPP
jgi:hypothetical protein